MSSLKISWNCDILIERVDFGKIIGYYVDPQTGKKHPTTMGIIHYSKNGAHIVPSKPKKER